MTASVCRPIIDLGTEIPNRNSGILSRNESYSTATTKCLFHDRNHVTFCSSLKTCMFVSFSCRTKETLKLRHSVISS